MSRSTEQRVKAFLDRQKEKSITPETSNNPHLTTEDENYRQFSTFKSVSQDKDEEMLSESIDFSQNNTINHGYNTPLDVATIDQSSEQDVDKNPNNADIQVHPVKKRAVSGYRTTYEKKKALQSGEPKEKFKSETNPAKPQKASVSHQNKGDSANKPAELMNRKANLRILAEDSVPGENIRQRTKSPLDKFFDQKLTIKKKIKKHLDNYSRDNPSYSSSKSRAKTPQHTQEEIKERSPHEIKSPTSRSRSPRPFQIQVTEDITTPQLSPANNKKVVSPMQSAQKKINFFRANSEKKALKQSAHLNTSKEHERNKDDGKDMGSKVKVASELTSLDKLLKNERKKNREGYFAGSETLSMKTDDNGLKDNSMKETSRREMTPSKFSESVSRDEIKSRSQTPRKDTERSTTPTRKSKSPNSPSKSQSSPSKRSTARETKMFEKAVERLEKLDNIYSSSYQQRGRQAEQPSYGTVHEERMQHFEFKQEIKKVLKNINEEKEQLIKNLAEMSTKLSDYEVAYNNLKTEFENYKLRNKKRSELERSGSKEEHANSSYLVQKEDEDEGDEEQLRKESPADFFGKKDAKNHKIEKRPELLEVFSIDQLNLSPNRASSKTRETKDDSLYGHVQAMNEHIEEVISRNPIKTQQSKSPWPIVELETMKPFEFAKYPEAAWITKDMNLNIRVFNPEAVKDGTLKLAEKEPKNNEVIVKVQRQMIDFLYRKLLHEESQRLTTEEQAHIMISAMETSLSPTRGKRKYPEIKKTESTATPGTGDTSKSMINEKHL